MNYKRPVLRQPSGAFAGNCLFSPVIQSVQPPVEPFPFSPGGEGRDMGGRFPGRAVLPHRPLFVFAPTRPYVPFTYALEPCPAPGNGARLCEPQRVEFRKNHGTNFYPFGMHVENSRLHL